MLYGFLGEDSRISPEDVDAFQERLAMKKRVNSRDPNRSKSAWFWFGPQEAGG